MYVYLSVKTLTFVSGAYVPCRPCERTLVERLWKTWPSGSDTLPACQFTLRELSIAMNGAELFKQSALTGLASSTDSCSVSLRKYVR